MAMADGARLGGPRLHANPRLGAIDVRRDGVPYRREATSEGGGGNGMLTPGQIAHFDTFGFLVLRQLFSVEETKRAARGIPRHVSGAAGRRPLHRRG